MLSLIFSSPRINITLGMLSASVFSTKGGVGLEAIGPLQSTCSLLASKMLLLSKLSTWFFTISELLTSLSFLIKSEVKLVCYKQFLA